MQSPPYKQKLILASASPRRQELVQLLGWEFSIDVPTVDETGISQMVRQDLPFLDIFALGQKSAEKLAESKAKAIFPCHQQDIILAADTMVMTDEKLLGKPRETQEAMAMLKYLAGREHLVCTGVCLLTKDLQRVFSVNTRVLFYPWDNTFAKLAREYVFSGKALDKAGAYGIQDEGALLVKSIDGDYFNVVGLPVAKIYRELIHFQNKPIGGPCSE